MKSIKHKLILANTIIVLFAVINTSAPNFLMEIAGLKKNVSEMANSKIENIWTNINLFLQTPINLTKNAVDYVKTHSITKDQTENYFEQMLTGKRNLSQLYYTNEIPYYKDGGFFYTSTHLDHAADYDQTQRSWYKQSAGNDGITITDPYVDSTTKELVTTVAHAVIINNKSKGVVGIDIGLSELTKMISEIKLTESGKSFLLDKNGRYITNDDNSKILNTNFFSDYKNFYQYKDKITVDKTLIEAKSKNKLYFSARTVSEESGWMFVTVGPIKELIGKLITDLIVIIVVAIFSIIIGCVISIFVATQIVKPIKLVDTAINEIANGNADLTKHIDVKSKDEIGSLVNGFNIFMEKLHSIVGQIKDSKNDLNKVESHLQESINNTSVTTEEILTNINNVNNQVAEQSTAVHQTSTTIAEIAENINSL
jgi:methyl-accepting chemotaxis protein